MKCMHAWFNIFMHFNALVADANDTATAVAATPSNAKASWV